MMSPNKEPFGRSRRKSRLFRLLLFLHDPAVGLICQLGEAEEIINSEEIVGVPASRVFV